YCHDCGARLDRSALAKVAPKNEDPSQTQRRLRQLLNPRGLRTRLFLFNLGKVLLGACLVASIIELLLPPSGLPERLRNVELQQLNLELEKAVTTHSTTPLQFTDAQVNTFIRYVGKSK